MDRSATDTAVKSLLTEIRRRTDEAAGLAKAAELCAQGGNVDKGVEIALDIEQLAYEAGRLLDAASLLNRIAEE